MDGMRLVEYSIWPHNGWGRFLVSGVSSMCLIQQFMKAVLQSTLKVEGSDVRDFVENAFKAHGVFLTPVKCFVPA